MKLQELEATYSTRLREYIAARLDAMGASEDAAVVGEDEEGLSRVLIASDAGLLDCHFLASRQGPGPNFEIKVTPWPKAPHPWIAMTSFVNPGWSVDGGTVTLSLALDPPFNVTEHDANARSIHEFAAAARRHSTGGSAR